MKHLVAILLLSLAAAGPVRADLPLLDGNLDVRPYISAAPSESSADLLLQLPEQIDGWAPVPLRLRVLQQGVESITLLTDEPEPVELAWFELEPGPRTDLSTRYRSQGEPGILALVRTADRVLAKRRSYTTLAVFGAPEPPADTLEQEPPALRLSARQDVRGVTWVELDGTLPLVGAVQHPELLKHRGPTVTGLELRDEDERVLLRAELSEAMALRPWLRLALDGVEAGETLYLRWHNLSGDEGELSATVASG